LDSFPLCLADEGESVRIITARSGKKLHERLGSMGLQINDTVTVIKKQPGGGIIIEKSGSRYALGGGMSFKIYVRRCD
jgi:ferrous iron transport protein A